MELLYRGLPGLAVWDTCQETKQFTLRKAGWLKKRLPITSGRIAGTARPSVIIYADRRSDMIIKFPVKSASHLVITREQLDKNIKKVCSKLKDKAPK